MLLAHVQNDVGHPLGQASVGDDGTRPERPIEASLVRDVDRSTR